MTTQSAIPTALSVLALGLAVAACTPQTTASGLPPIGTNGTGQINAPTGGASGGGTSGGGAGTFNTR